MKTRLLIMLITVLIFSNISPVFAQTFQSNSVTTAVGSPNPTTKPGVETPGERKPAPTVIDSELQQSLRDQFGLNFIGFETKYMRFAWEKMWDISGTNFRNLTMNRPITHGTKLINIEIGGPEQKACNRVLTLKFDDPALFNVILIHELGHIIYHCNDNSLNRKFDHDDLYGKGKRLTLYGSRHFTESYPEMITYYLHPGISERTGAGAGTNSNVPYANGKGQDFYEIAKRVLGVYP